VLGWEVWNEPDNPGGGNDDDREPKDKFQRVAALVPRVFAWARSVHPMRPLTSRLWQGPDWSHPAHLNAVEKTRIDDSDVLPSTHTVGRKSSSRTQTKSAVGFLEHPYGLTQPTIRFHDILHPDGTPYRQREVDILRALSAAPKRVVPDTLDIGR
jgi:hypothetical protein